LFVTAQLQRSVQTMIADMTRRTEWLETQPVDRAQIDFTLQLAAERALFSAIESTTDIASLVIDALIMRDPGGYADILKVLVEESVLTETWFEGFMPVLDFRVRLLRTHASLSAAEVVNIARIAAPLFRVYMKALANYLALEQ